MRPFRLGSVRQGGAATVVVEVDDLLLPLRKLPGGTRLPKSLDEILLNWQHHLRSIERCIDSIHSPAALALDRAKVSWLPPVSKPRCLICIGTNYRDHIAEMGLPALPRFPYAFLRPPASLAAHLEVIELPRDVEMVDWEAELAVVIGKRVRNVTGKAAMDAVAAYTPANDLSARDWIDDRPMVGIDWVMQKGWDKFQPTGPLITPAQFVSDPQNLAVKCEVNGVIKQDSNTSQMVFGVQAIIEHLSRFMTLEPGDIIATGTPSGVGFGRKPRESLKPGDIVRVTVEGLGVLENRMQ